MKKYIKRLVVNLYKLKIESCISLAQLSRDGRKKDYELLTYSGFSPVLTLGLITKDGNWKDHFIKITDRSLPRFNLCIRKVVEWFYDPDKKNMFVYDDNENLTFNYAYKELSEVYYDPFDESHFLKIMPTVVPNKNGTMVEGVSMYINQLDTMIQLSRYDLEDLMTLMATFSFQQEAILLLLAYQVAANEPDGIMENSFYLEQQRTDKALKAVPISNNDYGIMQRRKNPFSV